MAEQDGYEFPGTTKGLTLRGIRGGNARNARARGRRTKYMAEGGEVDHFCNLKIPHLKSCEYYAEGGTVDETPEPVDHPSVTLGHAAISHGLLGLLTNVGRPKMTEPDKHHKTIEKVRSHLSEQNHDKAVNVLHNHPLAGSVGKDNLSKIVKQITPALVGAESDPESLRGAVDYLHSANRGNGTLESTVSKLVGPGKLSIEPDEKDREDLKEHLNMLRETPSKMIEVGGKIGHYLPEHAAEIGALTSTATSYLNSLKPTTSQMSPMDEPCPPDKGDMAKWHRQIDVAQNPMLVLQHAKEGTLLPQDIITVKTLYPALYESIASKANEKMIEAKTKGIEIPYRQRQGLSALLGIPLDFTQTSQAMNAIIKSAGPQQIQKIQNNQKKATAAELKQIDKVDSLYETPLESRQMNKKE